MQITEKLAYEIYIILLFHILAILILISFSVYIINKAKKSAVLYSYLALASTLLLWMISKILKTVSPNEHIRWLFIVTQYFGVQFLGFFLILFAYIYTHNKIPSKKTIALLLVFPVLSFLAVITNPLHMTFYSYYDFYRDRFGVLFIPIQSVLYIYIFVGVLMLSKDYTKQAGFHGRIVWARLFAAVTLIPMLANVYYILFKMDVFEWIFPFPVFDFTPIAGSIALILFTIPALRYKFFDISPVSYRQIFKNVPTGVIFASPKGLLFSPNKSFCCMFCNACYTKGLDDFLDSISIISDRQKAEKFFKTYTNKEFLLQINENRHYNVRQTLLEKNIRLLAFSDVSEIVMLEQLLNSKNNELKSINSELIKMAEKSSELSQTRIKSAVAQNIHDILGHSLTVAICTAEIALKDERESDAKQKLELIDTLLTQSLDDLKNSMQGDAKHLNQTSLTKAISSLKNPGIELELVSQGNMYELDTAQTEAVFRICQEAMTNSIKHGKASKINIFLRYYAEKTELLIIDDGIGCKEIKKNYGLSGMENRVNELGGIIEYGSDGEKGFSIYVSLNTDKRIKNIDLFANQIKKGKQPSQITE